MTSIAQRLRETDIMDRALDRATQGVEVVDKRSLYYVVVELFEAEFGEGSFYSEYTSFTQDFLPDYERRYGRIEELVTAPKGHFSAPRFRDPITGKGLYRVRESDMDERHRDKLQFREANKLIVMEKDGLYQAFIENDFPRRLDAAFCTTGGFTTELGQSLAEEADSKGLPVCAIHDFDPGGVWIKRSLQEPTKRRDYAVDEVVDLGFTWEDIQRLVEEERVRPAEVDLGKRDRSRLDTLLERGEISEDAHEFLCSYEVKLNQLPPVELLEYIEDKLRELDLWKTIPDEEELQERVEDEAEPYFNGIEADLEDAVDEEVSDTYPIKRELDVYDLTRAVSRLDGAIRRELRERLEAELEEALDALDGERESPNVVAERETVRRRLDEDPLTYWERVAQDMAEEYVREWRDEELEVDVDARAHVEEVAASEEVREEVARLKEVAETVVEG